MDILKRFYTIALVEYLIFNSLYIGYYRSMKRILLIFIFTIFLKATINPLKYLDSNMIPLQVVNISSNEVLNLRLEPFYRSKIIHYIPHNAKNLITYDRDIVSKIENNSWVEVKVWFEDGFYLGWVRGKYLRVLIEKRAISAKDLVVIYPKFLFAEIDKKDFIHIYLDEMKECGDGESLNLKLKVYYSLRDVFSDNNFNVNYKDIARFGWFRKNNIFAKSVKIYGLNGYMSRHFQGGCIIRDYFFKIDGKILFIQDKSTDRDISKDKSGILEFIIKNLKVL